MNLLLLPGEFAVCRLEVDSLDAVLVGPHDLSCSLGIPEQYIHEAVVLPTARDMVDAFVDHIDIANARVFVNKENHFFAEGKRQLGFLFNA